MKSTIRRHIVSLFALWCITSPAVAAITEVIASVDKNPAMADETITLTITANDSAERDGFDPSPLLKDFVVGRTSVSSQTKMVNFNTSRTTVWTTTLIPRKAGQFRIPAFSIEGVSSAPIDLLVVPASSAGNRGRDLFVTTEVDQQQVYLQQQIKYTVKLHLAKDLQRGSLSAPTLENADVRQVGQKDKEYSEIVDGVRYRIIERVFAITPQQSGRYTLSGPVFEGEIIDNNQQSFGFFNRTKTVSRVGPSIDIEVLPIPSDFNHHWLPSAYVELNEEWQPANAEYRVGEPITRTLTLTALGLVEEQLPEIASNYPDAVKTYPDQASTATVDRDDTLVAQRTESVAIIPNQAGSIDIPEVTVPWFNIVTGQTEFASLPARTIEVLPALSQPSSALPVTPVPSAENTTVPALSQAQPSDSGSVVATNRWWSWSSTALLVVWLLTLLLWFTSTRKTKPSQPVAGSHNSEKSQWQTLQSALKRQDVATIRQPLTDWLGTLCQQPGASLPMSQQRLNNRALDEAISRMFASVYGTGHDTWQSDELSKILSSLRSSYAQPEKQDIGLKPLYPA